MPPHRESAAIMAIMKNPSRLRDRLQVPLSEPGPRGGGSADPGAGIFGGLVRTAGLLVLSVLLLSADAGAAGKPLTLSGSSTVRPVLRVAARIYGKKHNVRIKVMSGGSSKGIRNAGEGKVDIGMAARWLKPEEILAYPDIQVATIGYDGIALIVHHANPVEGLTRKQVRDLYAGVIRNWKDLGGADREVHLVSKPEGRSSQDLFLKYFGLRARKEADGMHFAPKGSGRFSKRAAAVIGPSSQVVVRVSRDEGAIAFVSIGSAVRAERSLGTVKRLKLDGVEATRENVRKRLYPIIQPLNLLTRGEPRGHARGLIDYLLGKHGQNIVKNLDYVRVR